ncbi:unnamed protein product [Laminaria digitata]
MPPSPGRQVSSTTTPAPATSAPIQGSNISSTMPPTLGRQVPATTTTPTAATSAPIQAPDISSTMPPTPLRQLPTTTAPTAAPPEPTQASDSNTMPPTPGRPVPVASYFLVDSTQSWAECIGWSLKRACEGHVVAIQLERSRLGSEEGKITVIKIAGSWPHPAAVLLDVAKLEKTSTGYGLLREQLLPMLADESCTKVVHDFTNAAIALKRLFGGTVKIGCPLDTQLAFEVLHGDIRSSLGSVERKYSAGLMPRATILDGVAGSSIPIRTHALNRAAQCVKSLYKAGENMLITVLTQEQRHHVLQASKLKIDFALYTLDETRWMTFRNEGTCWGGGIGRVMTSYELQQVYVTTHMLARNAQNTTSAGAGRTRPGSSISSRTPYQTPGETPATFGGRIESLLGRTKQIEKDITQDDVNSPLEVLQLVPQAFLEEHLSPRHAKNLEDLQEIVLDEGRRPKALLQERGRIFLCSDENRVVTAQDIDKVVGRLEHEGRFGDDNRAGFPGQLHRLSVMRRKQRGEIFAATLRIGRFFKGSAGIIDDILFHVVGDPGKPKRAASLLVLGEAGSGKTTIIRDVCRKISATQTVVIVDTSNEIAGDGNIPHLEAIGESRRMMVPNKADQHRVMIEALQNHTPQTIVVDEISNNLEAKACLDIKARGVRVVASAHGDLLSLLRNPNLNAVLGGTTNVTVGDKAADKNRGNKVLTQRAGAPVFDMVIEIKRGEVGAWSIIRNVAIAVDALLEGGSYEVERRSRTDRGSESENKDSDSEDVIFRLAYEREAETKQLLY